jgi:hypothetical protein
MWSREWSNSPLNIAPKSRPGVRFVSGFAINQNGECYDGISTQLMPSKVISTLPS